MNNLAESDIILLADVSESEIKQLRLLATYLFSVKHQIRALSKSELRKLHVSLQKFEITAKKSKALNLVKTPNNIFFSAWDFILTLI